MLHLLFQRCPGPCVRDGLLSFVRARCCCFVPVGTCVERAVLHGAGADGRRACWCVARATDCGAPVRGLRRPSVQVRDRRGGLALLHLADVSCLQQLAPPAQPEFAPRDLRPKRAHSCWAGRLALSLLRFSVPFPQRAVSAHDDHVVATPSALPYTLNPVSACDERAVMTTRCRARAWMCCVRRCVGWWGRAPPGGLGVGHTHRTR